MKHLVLLGLLALPLPAIDWTFTIMLSGGTADIASSLGRLEANPLARSANGRFALRKALPLKAAVCASLWFVRRKWPTTGRVAMATAGFAWTAVAVRNVTVK